MIVGYTPFYHTDKIFIKAMILKWNLQVHFPHPVKHKINMSEEVKDLITNLL